MGWGRLKTPGWPGFQNHPGSLSEIHVSGGLSLPPDTDLMVLGLGLEICTFKRSPGEVDGVTAFRIHCSRGTPLLPLPPLCLAPCQAAPGTVAEVCVDALWAQQTSLLRYAISSRENNSLVLVITAPGCLVNRCFYCSNKRWLGNWGWGGGWGSALPRQHSHTPAQGACGSARETPSTVWGNLGRLPGRSGCWLSTGRTKKGAGIWPGAGSLLETHK